MYVFRRRFLLWTPLALGGMVLLAQQLIRWEPVPALIILGIVMCLPWVCDV